MPRSTKAARAYGSSSGTRATKSAMNSSRCNQNQGGGDKKQGLLPVVGSGQFSLWNGMRRAGSTPESRRKVFCLNQLGGVGSGFYQTRGPSDGVKKNCKGSEKNEETFQQKMNALFAAIQVAIPTEIRAPSVFAVETGLLSTAGCTYAISKQFLLVGYSINADGYQPDGTGDGNYTKIVNAAPPKNDFANRFLYQDNDVGTNRIIFTQDEGANLSSQNKLNVGIAVDENGIQILDKRSFSSYARLDADFGFEVLYFRGAMSLITSFDLEQDNNDTNPDVPPFGTYVNKDPETTAPESFGPLNKATCYEGTIFSEENLSVVMYNAEGNGAIVITTLPQYLNARAGFIVALSRSKVSQTGREMANGLATNITDDDVIVISSYENSANVHFKFEIKPDAVAITAAAAAAGTAVTREMITDNLKQNAEIIINRFAREAQKFM